jgi:hypothetical protein
VFYGTGHGLIIYRASQSASAVRRAAKVPHQEKEVDSMKVDRFTKVILCIIAALLFLNFAQSLLASKPVSAASENDVMGRYQISAWAAYGGALVQHNGYYVVDTLTGKIVDKYAEVHPAPH